MRALPAALILLVGLGGCGPETEAPASQSDRSSADPSAATPDPSPTEPPSIGSAPVTQGSLTIHSAVIPEPASGQRMSVYAEIHSSGPADTLVGIASPIAAEGSLHDMAAEGGMMTMRPTTAFPVPAGGVLRLRSGERHGMLEGPSPISDAGDTVRVTFSFASGGEITVPVPVVPLTALVERGGHGGG